MTPASAAAGSRAVGDSGGDRTLIALCRLAAVTFVLAGALVRLYALPLIPGLHFDEAANAFDILSLRGDHLPIFFDANRGREPLFIYAQAVMVYLIGPTPFALRIASVFFGVLGIAALHFATRQLALVAGRPVWAEAAAGLAAGGFALSYWPISLSLIGLRGISLVALECLSIGFLWRAIRRDRQLDFALAGAATGLAMYTYLASRALPPLLLLAVFTAVVLKPGRRTLVGAALTVSGFAAVFAPLAYYFWTHSEDAASRADEVSILNPEHSGGMPVRAVLLALARNARAFSPIWTDRPAGAFGGTPIADPVQIVLLWSGALVLLVAALRAVRSGNRPRVAVVVFVAMWLGAFLAPSFLSVHVLHYLRAVGAFPALAVIAAVGASSVAGWLARLVGHQQTAVRFGLATALVAASGIASIWLYRAWLGSDAARSEYMAEKVDAATLVRTWSRDSAVFVAPLYYQDYTVRFVARDVWGDVRAFDPATVAVVPADRSARYVFPAIDRTQPEEMLGRLAGLGTLEEIADGAGRPIARVVVVKPVALEGNPLATIGGQIELAAASVRTLGAGDSAIVAVRLVWRARARPSEDLTVFVHMRDSAGRTVAQKDSPPGGGKLPTGSWSQGDTVLDDYVVGIGNAPSGEYRVVVGMYRPANVQRAEMRAGDRRLDGDELEIGQVRITR